MTERPDRASGPDDVPDGARPAARLLLLSDTDRVLLLQGRVVDERRWWVSPGGGLRAGESFEAAAARELLEETGLDLPIGPCLWTRRHRFEWFGRVHDQYERFFLVRVRGEPEPEGLEPDGYIIGHRWWSVDEVQRSSDDFSPRRLGTLLPKLLAGTLPDVPFDAGV